MITELQRALQAGATPADLTAQYGIKGTQHRGYPQLWAFKYDQIRSPMGERICQEARGSVLDASQNWTYAARAWDKFWNAGEGLAAPIDWATARVQEKVDGSLIILYWYDGHWEVATSGSPDASGLVWGLDAPRTFADLFWTTAAAQGLGFPADARHWTWLFELTTPQTRIVVRHVAARLTLIGCRHPTTGEEIPPAIAAEMVDLRVPVVREFPLTTHADVTASFTTFSPLAQEGYVVVSEPGPDWPRGWQWPRIKVKHPGYVALHHMKDKFTPRGFVEVVRTSETAEVLTAFPELTDLASMATRYDALCVELDADWDAVAADGGLPRKEFAARATTRRSPAYLFARLDGRCPDARTFLASMPLDSCCRLLGVASTPSAAQPE